MPSAKNFSHERIVGFGHVFDQLAVQRVDTLIERSVRRILLVEAVATGL